MSSYSKLLRDPRWQRMRLEIFSRDNWACEFCLDTNSELQVHHDYYIYGLKPWEYPTSILRTLCDACHELVHNTSCPEDELKHPLVSRYCYGTLTSWAVAYLFAKHDLYAI